MKSSFERPRNFSVQVQRASVARLTPAVNSSDFVILSFFFFFLVFSQKLRGRVTRNIEKKAHGLMKIKKNKAFSESSKKLTCS